MVGMTLALVFMAWAGFGPLAPRTVAAAPMAGRAVAPSTTGVRPVGKLVHIANCLQAPPQPLKDRATYTPEELARYGLPPRTPGEPFAQWAAIVRSAGHRVCDYIASNDSYATEYNSWNWDGNYADQDVGGQVYTEADVNYYVSCITGTPPANTGNAVYGAWVGLGGVLGSRALVQAGTAGWQIYNSVNGWQTSYWTFVENTHASDSGAHYMFPVSCGDYLWVKVWDSGSTGCMYIQRIRDGENTGNQCYGPKSDELTGEAIVEFNYSQTNFAKFGSETFYGVGITDSCNCGYNGYKPMSGLPHDYNNLYECQPIGNFPVCSRFGDRLAWTGSINSDPGDPPYDQYTIYWQNYA